MRERLYWAGCPTTPVGWAGFSLSMLVGLLGSLVSGNGPFVGLILISWLLNLATVHLSLPQRLVCHLAVWIVLWRTLLPAHPWHLVLLPSALLAGAVVWLQEQRKIEAGPVG